MVCGRISSFRFRGWLKSVSEQEVASAAEMLQKELE